MPEEGIGISAFLDEAVPNWQVKDIHQQLLIGQALGLKWWTPRFVYDPLSGENKNLVDLADNQIKAVIKASKKAGFQIACLGTGIGKEKLVDVDDKNKAPYTTPEQSKEKMERVLKVAEWGDVPFIRAFSFYGILGENPEKFYQQALDRVGPNVELCEKARRIYLMELESNLVAYNADMALRFCKDVNSPYLLICPDNANSHVQGLDAYNEFIKVAEAKRLGYAHVKAFKKKCPKRIVVDERALRDFCSVALDKTGYERVVVEYLSHQWSTIDAQLRELGAPGFMNDIEGHMRGGGQFGGDSGPDGIGVALRAYTHLLDTAGIPYILRKDRDVKKRPVPRKR